MLRDWEEVNCADSCQRLKLTRVIGICKTELLIEVMQIGTFGHRELNGSSTLTKAGTIE